MNRFACVTAGIRLTEYTYPWAKDTVNALSHNAGDTVQWLALADKLAESGSQTHLIVQAIWQDGFKLPEGVTGSITRGSRYTYNGQMHYESVMVSFSKNYETGEVELAHHYWSDGNWRSVITIEEARRLLSVKGGQYVSLWNDMNIDVGS